MLRVVAGFHLSPELHQALQQAFAQKQREVGWTVQQVADLVGVSKTTIHHLVSPRSHRPAKGSRWLPNLCQVLGVDIGAYLPLDDEQRAVLRALATARAVGKAHEFVDAVEATVKLLAPPRDTGSN